MHVYAFILTHTNHIFLCAYVNTQKSKVWEEVTQGIFLCMHMRCKSHQDAGLGRRMIWGGQGCLWPMHVDLGTCSAACQYKLGRTRGGESIGM